MSNINNNYNPFPLTTLSRTNSNGDVKIFHTTVIPTINPNILPNILNAIPGHSQNRQNDLAESEWLLPPDLPYFRVHEYNKTLLSYTLYTIHEEDEGNEN